MKMQRFENEADLECAFDLKPSNRLRRAGSGYCGARKTWAGGVPWVIINN